MPKTFREYAELGYPEDYLKNGDAIDMELARELVCSSDGTTSDEVEEGTGYLRAKHYTAMCGMMPIRHAIYRKVKEEPWKYIGEVSGIDGTTNRSPIHARRIFISSPYWNESIEKMAENVHLAELACKKIIERGNIPIAPHLYFPRFLEDENPMSREIGIECGLFFLDHCDDMIVILDTPSNRWGSAKDTITKGMRIEIEHAVTKGITPTFIDAWDLK